MIFQPYSRHVASLLGCACAVLFHLQVPAFAQSGHPPETRYVDCVRDNKGVPADSRTAKTPIFESKLGSRAYGVVNARMSSPAACHNTTTVYVAGRDRTFRIAFQQEPEPLSDGTVYDGNGIEALRWSPSGKRILVEVSQWTWGTDFGWNTKYVLITLGQQGAREIPVLDAVAKQVAQQCVRQVTSTRWLDDTRIEIEVRPAKDVDEDGETRPMPSCVQKPTRFSVDVLTGTLHSK
jgi:hypothetical protein